MRYGRQEDAHEFFCYVLDGLQKACLQDNDKFVYCRLLVPRRSFILLPFLVAVESLTPG